MTDARQERGLQIAKVARIDRKGDSYLVPSMSGNGRYTVDPVAATCTCPDCQKGNKCKHIFAVEFAMKRETTTNFDGSVTVTETVAIKAVKRTTYPQNWPAYNEAQTNEQDQFQRLLRDLCNDIETPAPKSAKGGRPSLALRDVVFATVFKVYSTFSGRRFISDLRTAHAEGMISKLPHFNSIFNYLDNPALTPILMQLIAESAKPLAAVESDFAVDSSGFTASRFVRWFDVKYNMIRQDHDWVKVHIMCGVKTNVVTAVSILDKNAPDSPLLPALVDETAKNFTINEVSADKGYSSKANHDAIVKQGATPFIMFRKNSGDNSRSCKGRKSESGAWEKMFHYFSFKRESFPPFVRHYNQPSPANQISPSATPLPQPSPGRFRFHFPLFMMMPPTRMVR